MKLCPECDFIYEDNQSFCDMDGKELIQRPAPEPPRSRFTIPVPPADQPAGRRSSGMAVAAVVVFALAALIVSVYVARTRQTRARHAVPGPQSSQALDQPAQSRAQSADLAQPQAASATDQNAVAEANGPTSPSLANQSSEVTPDSSRTALAHSRLTAGPVSASAATPNSHGSVLVRLTNGATIRADEAWEKREGVWYRQAGMVTFLKRSRVRSIERVASQPSAAAGVGTASTAATNGGRPSNSNSISNQNSKNTRTRDQLRIAKLEPVNQKKPSRVSSFLKKTGNLIKKPFRF